MSDEETIQELQTKIDKVKTLSAINNIHNLTPPTKKDEDEKQQIAIINALSSAPRLQEIFLEIRGMMYNPTTRQVEQISEPIMNIRGAWKFVSEIKKIASEAEFGNFQEEFIPAYLDHFFREIFPYYTFWHEEYELEPRNFDYIKTTLQMFLLSSFYKGKGGKYINVVGKTYSEDFLGKVMATGEVAKGRREGFLDRYNPFRKMQ